MIGGDEKILENRIVLSGHLSFVYHLLSSIKLTQLSKQNICCTFFWKRIECKENG